LALRKEAELNWSAWPDLAQSCTIVVLGVYLSTLIIGTLGYHRDPETGREALFFVCLRVGCLVGLLLSCLGVMVGNTSWARLQYTATSTPAVVIVLNLIVYLAFGLPFTDPGTPISSRSSMLFVACSILMWILLEAHLYKMSRSFFAILTVMALSGALLGIVATLFIWRHDFAVATLPGSTYTYTKFAVWRACLLNIFMHMGGSLFTVIFDWKEGKYLALVGGYVPKQEVLELDSLLSQQVMAMTDKGLRRGGSTHGPTKARCCSSWCSACE